MIMSDLEKQQLLSLVVSMFNAVPGYDNYNIILDIYTSNNNDLKKLAMILSDTDLYKNLTSALTTNSEVALFLLENFGLDKATFTGESIYNYFLERLNNKNEISQIYFDAIEYLTTQNISKDLVGTEQLLENKVEIANYYSLIKEWSSSDINELQNHLIGITSDTSSVENKIIELNTSKTAYIKEIIIPDGIYTYGAEINIEVIFNEEIYLDGELDCVLLLKLNDVQKQALLKSYTENSILFKFIVDDGYYSTNAEVIIPTNALVLNNTTIKDSSVLNVITTTTNSSNSLALITDLKAPYYELYNAHYSTTNNTFSLYGKGFESMLEYTDNKNSDISKLIDFTKLIWDFDSDDNGTTTTILNLLSTHVISSKVKNDNELNIVYKETLALESNVNFSQNDALDIELGFLKDIAGNISKSPSIDNLLVSIDNDFIGDSNNNIIYATSNSDKINSYSGDDIIYAKEGNDIINASDGDDIIHGGQGIDLLTGGAGNDIFAFFQFDSLPIFTNSVGIDTITDLIINSNQADLIDLDIVVENVNNGVSGKANQNSFINDLNLLLNVKNIGFDIDIKNDVSACIVNITSGDLSSNKFLVVDYNANDNFDSYDFIINITDSTIYSFNENLFI